MEKRSYVDFAPLRAALAAAEDYAQLQCECGCGGAVAAEADRLLDALRRAGAALAALTPEEALRRREPDGYGEILALCSGGNTPCPVSGLEERMAGAVLGRFAGCTLGVPVENWPIERMRAMADDCGMAFPPEDYWLQVDRPWDVQYGVDQRRKYTRGGMCGVPVDDDITYTILNLLVLERYGPDFTTGQVGELWREYLPCACTAEKAALENLLSGVPADRAAEVNNPYCQWIGADIRADAFGWAAAGNPRRAAAMAYRDAYLSHRRNGIYGEMFFAAAIAAAFVSGDVMSALHAGLGEIPCVCALHADLAWALGAAGALSGWEEARRLVDERFGLMHRVHTNNNACLTVFGLSLGGGDFTRTIGGLVAMGLDNDCTAATAGSLLGAAIGRRGIPAHWTGAFGDEVRTYLRGLPSLSIRDVIARFTRLAQSP